MKNKPPPKRKEKKIPEENRIIYQKDFLNLKVMESIEENSKTVQTFYKI